MRKGVEERLTRRQRIRRVLRSFGPAMAGVVYAVQTQPNMQIHVALGGVAGLLALWLPLTRVEIALVVLAGTLVVCAELMNTAVEAVVDMITREYHPLAKVAKDTAAGAVLVAAAGAAAIGWLVFGPHVWRVLRPLFD